MGVVCEVMGAEGVLSREIAKCCGIIYSITY